MRPPILLIAAAILAPLAAAAQRSDDDLIKACAQEAEERLFRGVSGHHGMVVASGVARSEREDLVNVTVASGEGRSISVTCKFRGGRLFDVRG